jgi:hypothetical protein
MASNPAVICNRNALTSATINDTLHEREPSPKRQKHQHIPTAEYGHAGYSAKRQMIRVTHSKIKELNNSNDQQPLAMDPTNLGLSDQQSKYKHLFKGLMSPLGPALAHPAAALLLDLAILGCSLDMGKEWTQEMLEAALAKGAHPSAMVLEAAERLRAEMLEKVAQGYARLMGWCDSPVLFCAASETARDVAEDLAAAPLGPLQQHALEGQHH